MHSTLNERPVCIVTGASGGIGRATSIALQKQSWRLMSTGRSRDIETSSWLRSESTYMPFDLSDREAPTAIVECTLSHFGRIDGLVHCAGTSRLNGFPDQEDDDWDNLLDLNLSAAHRMARAVGRVLLAAKNGGSIVFVSSVSWLSGGSNPAYGAAKGGLNSMTFHMAQRLGPHGIRVNAVAPGTIATEMIRSSFPGEAFDQLASTVAAMTPLRRLGDATDVAEVIAFLMSPRAAFVTGAVIPVSGGLELMQPISRSTPNSEIPS